MTIQEVKQDQNMAMFTWLRYVNRDLQASLGVFRNYLTNANPLLNELEYMKKYYSSSSDIAEVTEELKTNMMRYIPDLSNIPILDASGQQINFDNFKTQFLTVLENNRVLQTDTIFSSLGITDISELSNLESFNENFVSVFGNEILSSCMDNILQQYGKRSEIQIGSNLTALFNLMEGVDIEGNLAKCLNDVQLLRTTFDGYVNQGELSNLIEEIPRNLERGGVDVTKVMDVDKFINGGQLTDIINPDLQEYIMGADGFLKGNSLGGLVDTGMFDINSLVGNISGMQGIMDSFNSINGIVKSAQGMLNTAMSSFNAVSAVACALGVLSGPLGSLSNFMGNVGNILANPAMALGNLASSLLGGGSLGGMLNSVLGSGNIGGVLNSALGSVSGMLGGTFNNMLSGALGGSIGDMMSSVISDPAGLIDQIAGGTSFSSAFDSLLGSGGDIGSILNTTLGSNSSLNSLFSASLGGENVGTVLNSVLGEDITTNLNNMLGSDFTGLVNQAVGGGDIGSIMQTASGFSDVGSLLNNSLGNKSMGTLLEESLGSSNIDRILSGTVSGGNMKEITNSIVGSEDLNGFFSQITGSNDIGSILNNSVSSKSFIEVLDEQSGGSLSGYINEQTGKDIESILREMATSANQPKNSGTGNETVRNIRDLVDLNNLINGI